MLTLNLFNSCCDGRSVVSSYLLVYSESDTICPEGILLFSGGWAVLEVVCQRNKRYSHQSVVKFNLCQENIWKESIHHEKEISLLWLQIICHPRQEGSSRWYLLLHEEWNCHTFLPEGWSEGSDQIQHERYDLTFEIWLIIIDYLNVDVGSPKFKRELEKVAELMKPRDGMEPIEFLSSLLMAFRGIVTGDKDFVEDLLELDDWIEEEA